MARGKGDLGSINASLKSEPEFITVQGVDVTESLAFAAPPPVEDTTEGVGNPFRVLMTILLPLPFEASGLLIITARRFLPLREDIFEMEEEAAEEDATAWEEEVVEEFEDEDDDDDEAEEQEMEAAAFDVDFLWPPPLTEVVVASVACFVFPLIFSRMCFSQTGFTTSGLGQVREGQLFQRKKILANEANIVLHFYFCTYPEEKCL